MMKSSGFNNLGYDKLYKIVLIGDSCVGKSSLLIRYLDNQFQQTALLQSTISLDFRVKDVTINSQKVRFQFWDTAGQQKYKSINASYYRGASILLVMFSIDNQQSFNNIPSWIEQVKDQIMNSGELILVGTKTDLQRRVSPQRVKQLSDQQQIDYYQVSSKNGEGIEKLFQGIEQKISNDGFERISTMTSKLYPDFKLQKRNCKC